MKIISNKTKIILILLVENIILSISEAKYSVGMNPGIMVRLEQNTIN